MTKKLNQDEVINICKLKGYDLISEYVNNYSTLILKDESGYMYNARFANIRKGETPKKFHKNNPYSIQNIKLWIKNNTKGYELLSTEYIGYDKKLLFKCDKGHEFEMSWECFTRGYKCQKCSHQLPSKETVIYEAASWMMDLGVSEEDAKRYLPQSNKKIIVKCPKCNKEKEIKICKIYKNKSIGCTCGDGISYPEKFILKLLDQLNIKYIKEYSPKWINNKRFDFYLLDYNVIIEAHGGQHYYGGFDRCGGKTLKEIQENDEYKKQLALDNNINKYIIIDCRKSELEWMKKSILNSELSNIFNLNCIDWIECEEFAINSNLIKQVCDYWNGKKEWETAIDIGEKFNLHQRTILRYLKYGVDVGWCNYTGRTKRVKEFNDKKIKSRCKKIKMFKNGILMGIFQSSRELEMQSEQLFGVKLEQKSIRRACTGERKTYKGFTFKYVERSDIKCK